MTTLLRTTRTKRMKSPFRDRAPRFAVFACLFALVGCGNAAEDFENICHAEERSGAASIADPSARAVHTAQWLEANLSSRDAKEAMAALAHASPDQRGELLRMAARESGYDGPCPMADAN